MDTESSLFNAHNSSSKADADEERRIQDNLSALEEVGLGLNARTRAIAEQPNMTPEFIRAKALEKARAATGVLVVALEQNGMREAPTFMNGPSQADLEHQRQQRIEWQKVLADRKRAAEVLVDYSDEEVQAAWGIVRVQLSKGDPKMYARYDGWDQRFRVLIARQLDPKRMAEP